MTKNTKIIAIALAVLMLASATVLCMFAFAENQATLPEKVFVGDSVTIPDKTLSLNGESKAATVTVTMPDGGLFGGNKIVASQAGKYLVTYSATISGKTVTEQTSFVALRRPENMFVANKYATAETGNFTAGEFSYNGVLLTMKNNAEVTFDKVIDVTDFTRADEFLDFMVVPSAEGKNDFAELVITLTDVENSANVVKISVKDGGAENLNGRGSYLKIGANNQTIGGYEYFWDWTNNIPGETKFNTFFKFGTPTWMSFRGIKDSDQDGYYSMNLGLDYADKAFYVSRYWGHDYTVKVCDLDDVTLYGSDVWKGFTSGKMKVSFSVSGLTSASAKVLVGKVCGFDLSMEMYEDTTAPQIVLDNNASNPPRSVVGATYKVFDAVALDDFDDNIAVQTAVKYVYNGAEYNVNIVDGKFATNYQGKYIVSYVATDRSGNMSTKQTEVYCDIVKPDVTIDVPQTDVTSGLFEKVSVADAKSVKVNGEGVFNVSAQLIAPDGKQVRIEDNAFIPDQTGKYMLTYTATDYVGNAYTRQFTITVEPLTKPVFVTKPYLPVAFICGFDYDLPVAQAYEGNGTAIATKIYVDNVELNGVFTPSEAQATNRQVTVRYVAQGTSGTAEYQAVVKVIAPVVTQGEAIYIDQSAYFVTSNATATMEKDFVSVAFGVEGKFTFANKLNARAASITFACADKTFDSVQVVLSDSNDVNKVVTVTITYVDGKYFVALPHDGNVYNLGQKGESIGVSYNSDNYAIAGVDNAVCGKIAYYDNGNVFEGFGDTVYIGVACNTQSGATINFTNIVNQTLGHRSSAGVIGSTDLIAPQIVADDETDNNYNIGDTATIPAVKAFDVLNPIQSVKVTVVAPDGTRILNNVDGTTEHSIKLDLYGTYAVTYTATDNFGRRAPYYKTIFVKETESPKLEVNTKKIKKTYKVGDKIEIPSYTVSDNSGSYNLDVMLIYPDNYIVYLLNDNCGEITSCLNAENAKLPSGLLVNEKTFKLNKSGVYTLRYFAYDEFYNCVTVDVTIVVE